MVVVSPSTVALDHLYAKSDSSLETDVFSDATFLSGWQHEISADDHDLLNMLFGEDYFTALENVSLPRSESSSSDLFMTSSPEGVDDVELCEIISSSSASPDLSQVNDDFNIGLVWPDDFDLPDVEKSIHDQELVSVTSTLPTSVKPLTITDSSQPALSFCPPTVSSQRKKSSVLTLTSEEKRLLEMEGVVLPTDMPLTKAEEKVLKKVRRKIKNKQSAQESRRKKKDYVEGLEERVKRCTQENITLSKKVQNLETQNKSLLDQLKDLQALVASTHPSKAQAGTCLMVLFLAFGLVLFPINGGNHEDQKNSAATYAPAIVRSRTLLQVREEYVAGTEEGPETGQLNLSNIDYLKAAVLTTQTKTSDVTVAVSHIERSQESRLKAEKQ